MAGAGGRVKFIQFETSARSRTPPGPAEQGLLLFKLEVALYLSHRERCGPPEGARNIYTKGLA